MVTECVDIIDNKTVGTGLYCEYGCCGQGHWKCCPELVPKDDDNPYVMTACHIALLVFCITTVAILLGIGSFFVARSIMEEDQRPAKRFFVSNDCQDCGYPKSRVPVDNRYTFNAMPHQHFAPTQLPTRYGYNNLLRSQSSPHSVQNV